LCDFVDHIYPIDLEIKDITDTSYTKNNTDSTKNISETDIINMLEFFIDNIFAMFGEPIFLDHICPTDLEIKDTTDTS